MPNAAVNKILKDFSDFVSSTRLLLSIFPRIICSPQFFLRIERWSPRISNSKSVDWLTECESIERGNGERCGARRRRRRGRRRIGQRAVKGSIPPLHNIHCRNWRFKPFLRTECLHWLGWLFLIFLLGNCVHSEAKRHGNFSASNGVYLRFSLQIC